MAKYWFKPKSHGYGASPNTWEGWVVTAAAAVTPGVVGWMLLARPAIAGGGIGSLAFVTWAVVTVATFVGFLLLARQKTDGEWRWRWKRPAGIDENDTETLRKS